MFFEAPLNKKLCKKNKAFNGLENKICLLCTQISNQITENQIGLLLETTYLVL